MGGIWAGLKYIVTHPDAGDHFSEDLPTDFVLAHAFPWAGRLLTRPCPEVLQIPGFFDPSAPNVMERVRSGTIDPKRIDQRSSAVHGTGTFASVDMLPGTAVQQLPLRGPVRLSRKAPYNHSCAANAYVDRNRMIRTIHEVPAGEEVTLDYALLGPRDRAGVPPIVDCRCGAPDCRQVIGDWSLIPSQLLLRIITTLPILTEVEEDIRSAFGGQNY